MLTRMATPLIAGNWKMNKLVSDAVPWVESLLERLQKQPKAREELLLLVPATHVHPLAEKLRGSQVRLGAQDLSQHDSGAYTGEVSGGMLRDAGADFVLVGHSERRQYHQENDFIINAKMRAAQRQWLIPILCIGETAQQRDDGQENSVVIGQLENALDGLEFATARELVIAYEPVWSIGTGRTATAEDAQAMCSLIRTWLQDRMPAVANKVRILYGGSMKPSNSTELLAQPDINGGLIGGASLEVDDLLAIHASAS